MGSSFSVVSFFVFLAFEENDNTALVTWNKNKDQIWKSYGQDDLIVSSALLSLF